MAPTYNRLEFSYSGPYEEDDLKWAWRSAVKGLIREVCKTHGLKPGHIALHELHTMGEPGGVFLSPPN